MSEKEKKEKKIGLDHSVRSEDVLRIQEGLVKASDVSEIRKGLVRASDVEQARKEIEASKAKERKEK